MKKIIFAIGICMLFSPIVFAAANYDGSAGRIIGTRAQHSTSGYTIGAGDLLVYDEFFAYAGFMTYRDIFDDLEALSVTKNINFSISTTTLTGGTTSIVDVVQPTNPMNLVAEVSFATGEATTTVAGTLLITGVNARGYAATETLTISTAQATGSVAFASITSLAWTVTSVSGRGTDTATASLQVGNGTKVGLSNDIQESGDIIQVMYDDSGTTADDAAYTLNTTYDTIIFATTNDGTTDVGTVVYKVRKR